MINSISQTPKTTRTSIFYINDIHGQTTNMERLKTASDAFDSFTPQEKTDKLKFSSGDIMLGTNENVNKIAVKFQNAINIDATAIGNHECDSSPQELAELTKNANYKLLGFNTNLNPETKLKSTVIKSYIEEKDGNKYGVIGLIPFDLFTRIKKDNTYNQEFDIDDISTTAKELQEEIDKLQNEGVNKIILLSHTGYKNDVQLAKSVNGIDVILGGHSHDLIKGIEKDKNLIYSKNGDPVIITQAGRDGNYFGVLNLEFDNKGVITEAQNNVTRTITFPKNPILKYFSDSLLGQAEKVGVVATAEMPPEYILISENPTADFLADAMREESNADIALINAANLRANFEQGPVTTRDLANIAPFKNSLVTTKLSEKELVDAIKFGASSFSRLANKPGIIQVSGLKYTINKSGELLDLTYIEKDGTETSIDIKNPNPFKTYMTIMDDYMAKGSDGFDSLNKMDQIIKNYGYDKDKLAAEYIKKQTVPLNIKTDGRIKIVD